MEVKYENGRVHFDLDEILAMLTIDEKMAVADTLACQNDVIKFVTQQILDGWTELGSHGIKCQAASEPSLGLDWATREVAKRAGEVAKREIKSLSRELLNVRTEHAATIEQLYFAQDQLRSYR